MKDKQPKEKQPKQEKEFTIKAVKELPQGQRLKGSFYDEILDSCMNDKGNTIFQISVKAKDGKDKHWKSTYAPIDCRILKKRYPLKIFIREGKLYLQKYDTFEEMFKLRKVHKKKIKKAE